MSFSDKDIKWVITCEHAGNKIPHDYRYLFEGHQDVLNSHRGLDIGVKDAFNEFKKLADFWLINHQTRLLIEFNRSLNHPKLFSEFSNNLSESDKNHLIYHYYLPYRRRIEKAISDYIDHKYEVVHLSIHSFTPVLNEEERNADIGLLYDSGRKNEKGFCQLWKDRIQELLPGKKVKLNYPYLGKADGLTTFLRKKFGDKYLGIEVELNQKDAASFHEISNGMLRAINGFLG